jgi:23S rRNA (cytosine1962-C5)-methyltransferase
MERTGERPPERVPIILESLGAGDFHLIDSGNGEKLEQYGPYRIIRPEGQALWKPSLPKHVWDKVDAAFTGDTDEEGTGRWRFPKEALGETWPLNLLGVDFLGRFTSFRHVGVFPEQIVHWTWMKQQVEATGRPLKVLNLFGYTGVASLVAAAAGAEVTHVDASKKAIGWARENQALSGLDKAPIRWICEDAMKFILREERSLASVRTPARHARHLPRDPVPEGCWPRADGLFDPRQLLFHPRADARNDARGRRRGRIRRAGDPRSRA